MRRRVLLIAVTAVVLIIGGVTAAVALSGNEPPEVAVTEAEAVAAATEVVPGDVVEVELEKEDGVLQYEVEIEAEDGAIYEVMVDPDTARVLGQELDDDVPGEPDDDDGDDDD